MQFVGPIMGRSGRRSVLARQQRDVVFHTVGTSPAYGRTFMYSPKQTRNSSSKPSTRPSPHLWRIVSSHLSGESPIFAILREISPRFLLTVQKCLKPHGWGAGPRLGALIGTGSSASGTRSVSGRLRSTTCSSGCRLYRTASTPRRPARICALTTPADPPKKTAAAHQYQGRCARRCPGVREPPPRPRRSANCCSR